MPRAMTILLLLVAVAGCRIGTKEPVKEADEWLAAHGYNEEGESIAQEVPSSTQAAKVAAVMAANNITLPQVAAYLDAYGFDVINRSEFRQWTWAPAPAGTYPIAYYIANFRVATGTNSLRVYLPQTAGPYWIRVKAYDGRGNSGPWSVTNTSGPGELLPGVVE